MSNEAAPGPAPDAQGPQAGPAVLAELDEVPGAVLAGDSAAEEVEDPFGEEEGGDDLSSELPVVEPDLPPQYLFSGEIDDDDEEDDEEDDVDEDNFFDNAAEVLAWDVASGSDIDYEYDDEFMQDGDFLEAVAGSSDSSDDLPAPAPVSAQPLERSNFLEAASTQIHPCCTEANHHQTSDAVAISEAPFPSQAGSQQVVTTGKRCLQVYELLPTISAACTTGQSTEELTKSGQSRPMPDGPAAAAASDGRSPASASMLLRAEATNLPFQPYTLACTPNGRFIATGGSRGLMAVFRTTAVLAGRPHLEQIMLLQPSTDSHDAEPAAEESPSFINCLRFGNVAGKQRLLAATQSGNILMFDVPDPDAPTLTCSHFMATTLGDFRTGSKWEARLLKVHEVTVPRLRALGNHVIERQQQLQTLGWDQPKKIKPLDPLNCAVASPDGLMVAATGDFPCVLLLAAKDGFAWHQNLPANNVSFPDLQAINVRREHGSQYCVWHPDSVRLAVSSDLLRAVFVMDAVQRMTLMRFEDLRRPCMALAFPPAPSLAQTPILVFAENARNIYIADANAGGVRRPIQKLELPACPGPQLQEFMFHDQESSRRVTGLAVSPQGQLVISMPDKVIVEQLLQRWSLSSSRSSYPMRFYAAAQTMLLLASRHGRQRAADGEQTGLWSLPEAVVQQIIEVAAFPLGSWMNHRPSRPAQLFGKDNPCNPEDRYVSPWEIEDFGSRSG